MAIWTCLEIRPTVPSFAKTVFSSRHTDQDSASILRGKKRLGSLQASEETSAWIDGCVTDGMKVLIHCHYGIGRTGTVFIVCLFKKSLSLRDTLIKIKHTPSLPMSRQKCRFLREYKEKFRLPKAHIRRRQSGKRFFNNVFLLSIYRCFNRCPDVLSVPFHFLGKSVLICPKNFSMLQIFEIGSI